MKRALKVILVVTALFCFAATANAASVIMEGNYIRTAISDDGTLGWGGNTDPGIRHDPTGTKTWGLDDYLTPGTPWELFTVKSNQTGTAVNNNAGGGGGGAIAQTSMTNLSGGTYDNHVRWIGQLAGYFSIQNDYYFNNNEQRINMRTIITALSDLTGVQFLRSLDPDQDVNSHPLDPNAYDTINGRGFGAVPAEDWVHAEGALTGLTIGLYSDSAYTHNTGVSSWWEEDPAFYLAGTNDGNGDYTIGVAFDLGNMNNGDTRTIDLAYVAGGTLGTTTPGAVPVPGAAILLGSGLVGLAGYGRKKMSQK